MQHQEGHALAADGTRLYTQAWTPDIVAKAAVGFIHGQAEHSKYQYKMSQRQWFPPSYPNVRDPITLYCRSCRRIVYPRKNISR